jgi:hypothetical protein
MVAFAAFVAVNKRAKFYALRHLGVTNLACFASVLFISYQINGESWALPV